MKRRHTLRLLATSCFTPIAGATPSSSKLLWEWGCMGSHFRVYAETLGQPEISSLRAEVQSRLSDLESTFSVHLPDSEVLRLCRAGNASPNSVIPVSADLLHVTREAIRVSAETSGAFDLTMGSLTHYWRYCKASGKTPSPERLETLKKRVGQDQLKCHADGISFHPKAGQILLDYGGIAKGYAADQVLEVFKKNGIARVCLDLGGEILAGEAPSGKEGWEVMLTDHSGASIGKKVTLKNAALSTSGDRFQSLEIKRTSHSHILTLDHPSGLTTSHQSSIQAKTALEADALATVARIYQ